MSHRVLDRTVAHTDATNGLPDQLQPEDFRNWHKMAIGNLWIALDPELTEIEQAAALEAGRIARKKGFIANWEGIVPLRHFTGVFAKYAAAAMYRPEIGDILLGHSIQPKEYTEASCLHEFVHAVIKDHTYSTNPAYIISSLVAVEFTTHVIEIWHSKSYEPNDCIRSFAFNPALRTMDGRVHGLDVSLKDMRTISISEAAVETYQKYGEQAVNIVFDAIMAADTSRFNPLSEYVAFIDQRLPGFADLIGKYAIFQNLEDGPEVVVFGNPTWVTAEGLNSTCLVPSLMMPLMTAPTYLIPGFDENMGYLLIAQLRIWDSENKQMSYAADARFTVRHMRNGVKLEKSVFQASGLEYAYRGYRYEAKPSDSAALQPGDELFISALSSLRKKPFKTKHIVN
ncbi:hypothetical protein ACFL2D_02455 [Patescibacteria group bacterium]